MEYSNLNQKILRSEHRIRFSECDAFGHMNNALYLSHFIETRTAQLRDTHGFDAFEQGKTTGRNWVVQDTRIRYFYPAQLNKLVTTETRLLEFDRNTLRPEGLMYDYTTGRLHALVWFRLSYVDLERGRPARHEPEFLSLVESLLDDSPELERDDFEKRIKQIQSEGRVPVAIAS